MKIKTTHYIFIYFFFFFIEGFFAQDLSLELSAIKKIDKEVLGKIEFQNKHKDSNSVLLEVEKISNYLKNIGYFTNTFDSLKKIDKKHIAFFTLNEKIENAIIRVDNSLDFITTNFKKNNNKISIPIKNLESTISEISLKLDNKGKSFSKIQLKNISIKDKTLYTDLIITQSKKRTINKVIIKGYEDFPKSFLKNHFYIKPNNIFNQKKINEIEKLSKNIKFIKAIKPPEILFTTDSTFLYLYFKKIQNNSFDGIVNFASKEDGGVFFNGNINLKLNNILNAGESLELFWNSIGKERQEFNISSEIPYLFNSKLSPQLSFSIYKQDSTFLNSKLDSKLFYNINPKTKIALTYISESSENLIQNQNDNIKTFSNSFFGFQFEHIIPKNNLFYNNKFTFKLNPTFGKRRSEENSLNQFKIETSISYIWELNLRNSFFIKNKTGYLNSKSFIDNELFRIGGANSIRGFNEQSIFTSNFSYFNIEYRYLTSNNSYFYTISDIGIIDSFNKNITGLGLGYLFLNNKSLINISLAIGKQSNVPFEFKNSKLIIGWTNYF